MKRGVFFSLDVLFAVILATSLITGFYFYLNRSQEDTYPNLYLSKVVNDALTILDKNKTLETLNVPVINNSLIGVLPSNTAWQMNITTYASCALSSPTITVFRYPPSAVEDDYIIGRRTFITLSGTGITSCSTAELRAWLR